MTSRLWSRRHAIGAFAASATGPIASSPAFAQKQEPAAKLIVPDKLCLLTPRAIEGPYYFDPKLMRSDVTEARPGVPLRLRLQVLEARNCTPLKNARVDIWHADAIGHYSGYERQGDDRSVSTTGPTFLRGTQLSDEAGLVVFRTLYPGWYEGRTPHIHFRAFVHDRSVLTGQLYFADALSEFIYSNVAPYNTRKLKRDTVNATDLVLRQGGGGLTSFCSIREEEDCYDAAMVIGVNRDAIEMPDRFGPPDAGFARGGPPPEFDHRGERQIPDLGAALVPGVNKRS